MSAPGNGGPAFPSEWAPTGGEFSQGMSLRDWFAGRVLQGLLSNPSTVYQLPDFEQEGGRADLAKLVADSYRVADAMLAERTNGGAR